MTYLNHDKLSQATPNGGLIFLGSRDSIVGDCKANAAVLYSVESSMIIDPRVYCISLYPAVCMLGSINAEVRFRLLLRLPTCDYEVACLLVH